MLNIFKKRPQLVGGRYRVEVVSLAEECDHEKYLPAEILYIFKRYPVYLEKIRAILNQGKAIGVRTILRTPEHVLKAVHAISVHSQGNYILTWLPKLLKDKHLPHFTEADRQRAERVEVNLSQAVKTIIHDRLCFKKLVLIDEENIGIKPNELRLMKELTELVYPVAID